MKSISIPNNFYEKYQPKFATALKILGRQKYMKALGKIRKKYSLDLGMEEYQEHIIEEILKEIRGELK